MGLNNRLQEFREWNSATGWRAASAWQAYRIGTWFGVYNPKALWLKPRQARHPVLLRLGDSSDIGVFHQIFTVDEYCPLRDIPSPRVILDLGANVGYASAYFLSCFPEASVVAVEPDPRNVTICKSNLDRYGKRATVVAGAIWSHRTKLALSQGNYRDGKEWATQVTERAQENGPTVDAWDISSLLALTNSAQVDLLKIDIERSEIELFRDNSREWLPRVRNICIELHGEDCEDAFFGALKDFDYEKSISGELTICRNLRLRH